MFKALSAFNGISVDDLSKAKVFYTETLKLELENERMGLLLRLPGGGSLYIYEKSDHQPAKFTVLNFVVKNIDESLEDLKNLGVTFEHYDNLPGPQDNRGVLRGLSVNQGPDIAWFKDPAGNILSLIQEA